MMQKTSVSMISALILLAGSTGAVLGIGQANGPAVVPSDPLHMFVGKLQTEDMRRFGTASHLCTGSLIAQNTVLTAGHCVGQNDSNGSSTQFLRSMRFWVRTRQFPALAVSHPQWTGNVNFGANDIATLLLLNAHGQTPRATLATATEVAGLTAIGGSGTPTPIAIAGYSNGNGVTTTTSNRNRLGTTLISAGMTNSGTALPNSYANGLAAPNEIIYDRTSPNTNVLEQGDSGGPSFATVMRNGTPTQVLIGVHSFGHPGPVGNEVIDVDTRVTSYLGFVQGQGVSVSGNTVNVLNNYSGIAGSWFNPATWNRVNPAGGAATNTIPQATDIVRLDPTSNSDSSITIPIDGNSPTNDIGGLLTDVTLDVRESAALRVSGKAGVLNGGWLRLRNRNGGVNIISYKLDNVGLVEVEDGAMLNVGTEMPATFVRNNVGVETISMLNDRGAALSLSSGAIATFRTQLKNQGTISVQGSDGPNPAILSAGYGFPAKIGFTLTPSVLPTALHNDAKPGSGGSATVLVGPGGWLNIQNGIPHTAQMNNGKDGRLALTGNSTSQALADIDVTFNNGQIQLNANSQLRVANRTTNRNGGTITLSGVDNTQPAVAELGALSNGVSGTFSGSLYGSGGRAVLTINNFGSVTVERTAYSDNLEALKNGRGSLVDINPGGTLISRGDVLNYGRIELSSDANGVGYFQVRGHTPPGGTFAGMLANHNKIDFTRQDSAPKPHVLFDDADFQNQGKGRIIGPGQLTLTENSSFENQLPKARNNNWNNLDVHFAAATTFLSGFVSFEVGSTDIGQVIGGLNMKFSLQTLRITNGSKVELVDLFDNNAVTGDTETLYVKYLSVDAQSTLDLGNRRIFYQYALAADGGIAGTIQNGALIQIPTPGTGVMFMVTGLAAIRRRRS